MRKKRIPFDPSKIVIDERLIQAAEALNADMLKRENDRLKRERAALEKKTQPPQPERKTGG